MSKQAITLLCTLVLSVIVLQKSSMAQLTMEMKDTYFHRFYYRSIIMGSSSVGKYNLDYISGKKASALGFILDIPNPLFKKRDNISQTTGIFFYGFEDKLTDKGFDTESQDSINGTAMTALSVCYGWNVYDLPLGINIYAGLNIYTGSKTLQLDTQGEQKDKFFAPAPYFYINKPWGKNLFTYLDLMMRQDYKDLAKVAGKVLLSRSKFDVDFISERNSSEYSDSYLSALSIKKKFGSAWFFKNVVGLFSSKFRNLDPVKDSAAYASFDETDAILGTPGYLSLKAGTAFVVNNLANEKVGDYLGNSGNYFGKFEFGYVLGMGFSYKVEEGFGWKIGLNYQIDLDAAGGVESGDSKMDKLFKGKNVFVRVEYYKNYVNDDIMGVRIDPSMFRLNLLIR